MANFHQAKSFLAYWLNAVDEHSLHSPFFFDFYTKVLKASHTSNDVAENLRAQLLKSTLQIEVTELGAGSVIGSNKRFIRDIAKMSLSNQKFSALYARVIAHYHCKNIIELGTSLGINSLYLTQETKSRLHTFEGVSSIAELARDTFNFAGAKNVNLIEGPIDETLPVYLQANTKLDFAFIDANHRYEPAMRYFNWLLEASHDKTILVFDDIHLSAEMEKAWREIQQHDLVYATADLFRCGFVFLDPSLNRLHKVLQF